MTKSRSNSSYANEKNVDFDVENINCCQLNVHKAKIRESRSKYHNYPEKRLFHRRSCTDLLCLLFFLGCLSGWIYLGCYALKSTPISEILAPTDYKNRRCGFDEGVKNKPNVFYFDLLKCVPPKANVFHCDTPRVCVSECPQENFYLKTYLEHSTIPTLINKLICKDDFDKANIHDKESAASAVQNNDCAEWYLESQQIYGRCIYDRLEMYQVNFIESYFNESGKNHGKLSELHVLSDAVLSYLLCFITHKTSVHKRLLLLVGYRCLPKSLKNTGENIEIAFESLGKRVKSTISQITGKKLFHASKTMTDLYEFGHAVFRDLTHIWPWLLIHICGAAMVSFLYITIMRWISGIMVWLSVMASVGLLIYSSYYTWFKFQELSKYENGIAPTDLQYTVMGWLWKKETWLGFFILSVVLLGFILITIIFLRTRISLAVELIKEGSKAVVSSWSAVIFPIFPWIVQVSAVTYGLLIFAYLINSGIPVRRAVGLNGSAECQCENNYEEGSLCDEEIFKNNCHAIGSQLPCTTAHCLFSENETQKHAIYLQLYNLFMVLWSLFFASGFGRMVLASSFATYYWTFNKDDLPIFIVAGGVWRVLRYHLGTVSVASFLLALCNYIRVIVEFVYNYLNKYNNTFTKFIKCCCSCAFWCLNTFLKFLNKNAYIMCAIYGENFCSSARLAFNLLMRNILRVVVLDRVTDFLVFLGKVMVTSGLGLLSFHFFSNPVPPIHDYWNTEKRYKVEYYFVPMVIVSIATYFISSLFFGVYSVAVDTLFLCALEDLEANDGSPEKPYFMSKNLMKILKKRNEFKVK